MRDRAGPGCRTLWVAMLLGTVGGVAGLPAPAMASGPIRWRGGPEGIAPPMTRDQRTAALTAIAAAGDEHIAERGAGAPRRLERRLMRFDQPLSDLEKAWLEGAGVRLMSYLGENAYFVSIDAGKLDAAAVGTMARLVGIEAIQRRWKLQAGLEAGEVPPWALVPTGKPVARPVAGDADAAGAGDDGALPDPVVALYVMFHADAELDGEATSAVRRQLGEVKSYLDSINAMVVELPASRIKALADEPSVQYIEAPLPAWAELNAENRSRTQASTAQAAPYGLDGAGVQVLVYDSGQVLTSHSDFGGRAIVGVGDTSGLSDHSTHVAGTVGGSGAASGGNNRGMAPAVGIVSYGFQHDGSPDFLYLDPGDIQSDYTAAITSHGADIANNSIGTNTAANGFPCAWEGDYGVTDALIDSIVRGGLGTPFRVVWANGNERGDGTCGTTYHTSAPPACAKNHLTVGALNSNDDSMSFFSSWGPADDGRLKPDVSAPGCQVGGDGGVTSTSATGTSSYTIKCGTSMAAPTVTGCAALLLQDYRVTYPSAPDFRNSMLRSVFAQTAIDLGNPGPDYQFGYGSVRVIPAIELMRSGNFVEAEVSQGGFVGAVVVVEPGQPKLTLTMAWDDVPGTPNVSPALVNDLDLVVYSPSSVRAYPWTLGGLANPSAPAVRSAENHTDNIEQVQVDNPEPGVWVVEVRGTIVPQGPQPFSLVSSSSMVQCAEMGVVSVDKNPARCAEVLTVRVVDCGLNLDDGAVETVQVNVASNSNPTGLTVTLTEIAAEAADFRAAVTLSTSAGPGELLVAHGDSVTVTYQDADTGSGSPGVAQTTAAVDCQPAVISALSFGAVNAVTGSVSFTTDEPARSTVRYGLSCGALSEAVSSPGLQTSHVFALAPLAFGTTYFLSVECTDAAGNPTLDDNGGACHQLSTPVPPDYFTEAFTLSDNDLDNRSILFTPTGTPDGYTACSFPIALLPTDPTGGTTLNMGDDGPGKLIVLGGGQTVKLYGVSYAEIYANPNGNITFGSEDRDAGETLTDHFARARIAALFDDLDPATGGKVSWKQTADRVVITYENVPQYQTADANTFQYELFFDGRIRLSYMSIGVADGLAGLSRGTGLPADFFESNLSGYGSCGPMPPSALGVSVVAPLGHSIEFVLPAIDDGLPAPPAALQSVVTSLPSHGVLVDPAGVVMTSVPHTLLGGGSAVRYAPLGVFQGSDSFTYLVNDSGSPPQGGDSNSAAANITVGVPGTVYSFLVDDTNPGWFLGPATEWSFGPPAGLGGAAAGGIGGPDPTSGFTGANVLGYNLGGNYTNNLAPARNLISNAINCTNLTKTTVEFRRWLGVESSTYDHATFQVSTNLINWTVLWSNPSISMNPSGWTLVEYDISAVADNKPAVYLRWTMGTTDSSAVYCGWNLDDIRVKALSPIAPCPGDANGDRLVNFADITSVLATFGTLGAGQAEGDANADALVDFQDVTAVLSNWGTVCP